MGKNKKILILLVLLSFLSRANAQDKVLGIIIELTNGEKVECRLADNPKLLFDGTTINLIAEKVDMNFAPEGLLKVSMGNVDDVSAIERTEVEQCNFQMKGGFVRLSGFEPNQDVKVYTTAGTLIATYEVPLNGSFILSLESLPSGVSIIKTKKQSIKISKR